MKIFLAIVGFMTAAITGLMQYNNPGRRKERQLRGLDKKLDKLQERSALAWSDKDMDSVSLIERDIAKLRRKARRITD